MNATAGIGAELREHVATYCKKYRNPQLPPFIVSEPHTMTSWYGTPEAARPGCYVFYSQTGEVLYVGKASLTRAVGNRLAAHDHSKPRTSWRERAAFVQFVSVSEPFEAPSLEEFLVSRLCPIGNIRGGRLSTDPALTSGDCGKADLM
jgi:hypothetical protein